MSCIIFLLLVLLPFNVMISQVNQGAAAAYGLRKLVPSYTGNAIQVRRVCDNATKDIGFTSCGDLDTVALKTFIVAANPLTELSAATPAAAAFSMRKLKCSYTGSAICVRSSASGSPTLDIGYTSDGDLDTAALKTFVGVNSAFVTIWYDQSGNGRNAAQATASLQPRIVNAGVVERQNSMPAVRWLGQNYALATAPFTGYSTAACFNSVVKVNTDLTYNTHVNKCTNNYPAPIDFYNNQGVFGAGSSSYVFGTCSQNLSAAEPLSIWTYQFAASTFSYNFFYNGTAAGNGTGSSYVDNGDPLVLGSRADQLTGLNGWISEVITFGAIPSNTERHFLEWSQSQYYSISGPTLSLPSSPNSGSVSIWYDQSGNSRHAVQTNTINQPRLVNAGVIDKAGSNPAIYFQGFPQNLVAPLATVAYPISISLLASTSGSASGGAFVKHGNSSSAADGGIAIGIGNSGGSYDNSGTSVIGLKELITSCPSSPNVNYPSTPFISTTVQQAAGAMNTYLNGVNIPLSASATAVGTAMSGNLFIGGYTNGTNRYAIVKETELSIFAAALSGTRKALIETNQATYYGVTLSGSKYTPPSASSYNRYVNGVGRESAADSVAGTPSTTGMGFIVGQTANDFLKDNGDYLTIGMNCPYTPSTATTFTPATITLRWFNDWYLNKTDVGSNSGTVNVFFDFGDYGVSAAPGTASNYELLTRTSTASNFAIVTSAAKAVSGDRVLFTVNTSNMPTNQYYTIGTKNANLSPLPIELVAFDAACSNNVTKIAWSTATQLNNNYFTIERTTDGINFEVVGKIKGAGNSSSLIHYTFNDEQPLAGTSYYRLKQTDFDGQNKTYKLASVFCSSAADEIKIYPNPNAGSFTIEGAAQNTDVSILSSLGKIIWQQKVASLKQAFDASTWPNGVYFVKIGSEASVTKKLIIQH